MRRRSNSNRCLFCLAYCSFPEEKSRNEFGELITGDSERSSGAELVMAGAVNCHQLERQLENMFILRRMLDVPENLCEEMLREGSRKLEEDHDEGNVCGGSPAGWFSVCAQCMETSVSQAWRIYQQILALEVKMLEIKEKVKGRMKEEMMKPRNRGWAWRQFRDTEKNAGDGGGRLEGKIRRFLFPDFKITKAEIEIDECDLKQILDDEDVEMEFDNLSNYSESGGDWSDGVMIPASDPLWNGENAPTKTSFKRRRGRPTINPALRRVRFAKKTHRRPGRPPKNPNKPPLSQKRRKRKAPSNLIFDEDPIKPKKWNWHCCHEPNCRAKYTSREELEAHRQLHEERRGKEKGPLDCPLCSFPAGDTRELELHTTNRHLKGSNKLHYSCPKCEFRIENDFPGFKDHFDKEHPPLPEERSDDDPDATSSELPVSCALCTRRCENLRYYSVHLRKMHPEHVGVQVECLECNLCSLKFTTQLELKTHVNGEHKRPSKYVCDECGQGFQFASRLEAHKIKHVSKTKRDYVCHLCGLDYAYKYVLDNHYRKCHPLAKPGEVDAVGKSDGDPNVSGIAGQGSGQEHTCKYCEFTSPLKGIMIRHLNQHKQEIGHRCDQCGKCYVNEAGLKRHLRINHPTVKENVPCPYCGKAYISTEYMKDHVTKYCKLKRMELEPSSLPLPGRSIAMNLTADADLVISSIIGSDESHSHHNPQQDLLQMQQQQPQNLSDRHLQHFANNFESTRGAVAEHVKEELDRNV